MSSEQLKERRAKKSVARTKWLEAQIERSLSYNLTRGPLRPEATWLDYLFALLVWILMMRLLNTSWAETLISGAVFFTGHALYVRWFHKPQP